MLATKAVSADRLQRTQNVFFGFLQSGAKLIGILPGEKDKNRQIVKMLPVPMSPLLLSVGNILTLWSDWSSPGKEKVVWDFKLKQTLKSDLKALSVDITKMRIVDAYLMPTETGADKAVLLVLSVVSDALSEEDYVSPTQLPCALWMHTLEVLTPHSGFYQQGTGDQPVRVMHRVLVGEGVQFNMLSAVNEDGSLSSELGVTALKPRISSLHPSWRVYLSWSGFNVNLSTYTLHCAQFDLLNQPVIDQESLISDNASVDAALESVRCLHAVDSGISASVVVDTSSVEGLDGVVVLVNDGSLLLVSPPLPDRAPRDFPAVKDSAQIRVAPADPKTLLMAIASGEVDEAESLRELRDLFVALSPEDILQAVREVSHRVLNRAPTGQYWGTSSNLRGLTGQDLTRYQMVHRLVEDKTDCHRRLLKALDATNIFSFEEVRETLFSEHQQLLLCAGLSGAVQESQLRLSNATVKVTHASDVSPMRNNFLSAGLLPEARTPLQSSLIGSSDPTAVFSVAAHKASLRVIARGMDMAVRRRVSLEDIESQGLSVVDQFFSEAAQISDGVLTITEALYEAQADSSSLFHAAYGVASTLLAAVTFANNGDGATLYAASIMCHPKTRQALLQVVELLHVGLHKLGGELPAGFSLQREGKRLQEFCSLLLTGFVIDATNDADRGDVHRDDVIGSGEGGEHMTAEWRTQYHAAKTSCVTLLLAIKHANAAFILSDEHLLFSGLMEAVELDAAALQPQLETVVRTKGFVVGTDDVPLATACLLWLEENKRSAAILTLGSLCKPLLDKFLESRPHLAWMNHLKHSRYAEATHAAVSDARHVSNKTKAQSLLSIAKLSSVLAVKGDAPVQARQLRVSQSAEKKSVVSEQVLEDSVLELKASLAVMRCQEYLQTLCPSEFPRPDLRANVSDLVGLVTRIIHSQNSDPQHVQQQEIHFNSEVSHKEVVQCFGLGISLLHMQLEVVETLARAAPTPGSSSKRAIDVDLAAQTDVLRNLLVSLWAALVTAQSEMWTDLSAIPNLSANEENLIREHCLLFKALVSVCDEVAQGNIKESLLPSVDGELLDAMVAVSGVAGSQDAPNKRVVYILKVCVEMALLSERADGVEMGGIEQ
eukprot:gene21857-27929_t